MSLGLLKRLWFWFNTIIVDDSLQESCASGSNHNKLVQTSSGWKRHWTNYEDFPLEVGWRQIQQPKCVCTDFSFCGKENLFWPKLNNSLSGNWASKFNILRRLCFGNCLEGKSERNGLGVLRTLSCVNLRATSLIHASEIGKQCTQRISKQDVLFMIEMWSAVFGTSNASMNERKNTRLYRKQKANYIVIPNVWISCPFLRWQDQKGRAGKPAKIAGILCFYVQHRKCPATGEGIFAVFFFSEQGKYNGRMGVQLQLPHKLKCAKSLRKVQISCSSELSF